MDQIENTAIQTFSMVPEVYQQAFIQAGAEFPDELVAQIKQDPNQAIELVNSDKALKNAVVTIFKNNQEAIMDAINKQTGMFKAGGKLDQGLKKFQPGGTVKKRKDGVNGSIETGVTSNGVNYTILSKRNPNGVVQYTERQITPQKDTTYYLYDNTLNSNALDKYASDRKYVTPQAYSAMSWLKKLFNKPASKNWETAFKINTE